MSDTLDAIDLVNEARRLVEAIEMAATPLEREHAAPIRTVAVIASDKLKQAVEMLGYAP
jgi:hypothetical protein